MIKIEIELKQKSAGGDLFKKRIDQLSIMSIKLDDVNRRIEKMNALIGAGGKFSIGGRGGGGNGNSPTKTPPVVPGRSSMDVFSFWDRMNKATKGGYVVQRQMALRNALLQAQSTGNFRQMAQLVPHLDPANPKAPQSKVMQAIMTSRIGTGGGVMPLVGKSLAAFEELGVAAGPLAAAFIGLKLATAAATLGIEGMDMKAQDAANLGSSSQEARDAMIGTGVDAKDLYSSFKQSLNTPGGQAAAASAGVPLYNDPLGGNMDANKVIQGLKKRIESASTFDEAKRVAAQLGKPEIASWWFNTHRLGSDASPDDRAWQSRFDMEKTFGGASIRKKELGGDVSAQLYALWEKLLEHIPDAHMRWSTELKTLNKSVNENSQAVRENSAILGSGHLQNGGARGNRAMPSSLKGYNLNDEVIVTLGSGMRL